MRSLFVIFCATLLLAVGCEDPIQLGAGLVDGEINDPEFNDTLALDIRTVAGDSVITYRNSINFNNSTYLLGKIEDPVFGSYRAETYFSQFLAFSFPDFSDAVLDSAILVFLLDSTARYGNEEEIHNIEVFQLDELPDLASGDTLYSNAKLSYSGPAIGSFTGRVSHSDSLTVYTPITDTLIDIQPQLRVPLDIPFWSALARDTAATNSTDALQEYLRGLAIVSDADNSMIGLRLDETTASKIDFYFTVGDTASNIYSVVNGEFRHSYFELDHTGTEVEDALSGTGDLLYIQSMGGPNLEVDLSPVLPFADSVIVNAAILELTVKTPDAQYPPIRQLVASYDNDGTLFIVEDVAFDPTGFRFFGGSATERNYNGEIYTQYNLSLSGHINNILNGQIDETTLVITPFRSAQQPRRSVIFGSESSIQAARLKLITTKP